MDDQREPGQELDPSSAALTQALRMLSKRDYSEAEMQMRLSRRGYSGEQISFALDRLKEAGYLDEHRYAQRKAVDSRQVQIVGRRRAMEDLQKRQIAEPVILKAVETAFEGSREEELAERHLRERLPHILAEGRLEEVKTLRRAYGRLRRAGFTHGVALQALRKFSELAASLDDQELPDEGD